jgi:hypothetical protein
MFLQENAAAHHQNLANVLNNNPIFRQADSGSIRLLAIGEPESA